jgi:hypothetical protein
LNVLSLETQEKNCRFFLKTGLRGEKRSRERTPKSTPKSKKTLFQTPQTTPVKAASKKSPVIYSLLKHTTQDTCKSHTTEDKSTQTHIASSDFDVKVISVSDLILKDEHK